MSKKRSPILEKLAGGYFRWCPNCGAGRSYLRQDGGEMRCVECGFEWSMFDYYYDRNSKSYVRKDNDDDDCSDDDVLFLNVAKFLLNVVRDSSKMNILTHNF